MSRLLTIFLLALLFISCKQNVKKDIVVQVSTDVHQVEENQNITKKEGEVSQEKAIDFLRKFYVLYLTDINEDTNKCMLSNYLTPDLIKSIDKSDGYPIIDSQDYEKIDLNTLKVSKTNIENVFKVSFINYDERRINIKLIPIKESFKISGITIFRKNHNYSYPLVLTKSENKYSFDFLKYNTDPDDPYFSNIYTIEDFDANTAIFKKVGKDESYEYFCFKKKIEKGLELFYQKDSEYDVYNGDRSKPLIILYKKGEDFYAKSPFIEDGKEVKFKERGW
ncbi:hypothetical protein [Cellulophaga baltica]|uniref:hypothetical protein n=1 Tax=Cellulophaga baltica TaxID=76594 RepID=UPI002494FF6C|nr:hypothetical protein [Cellulophaga baltica]